MASNWRNYYRDHAVHHITGTVHGWQPILICPDVLSIFKREFSRMVKLWDVKIKGFVIMPEHFHMLAQSKRGEDIMMFIRGGRRSVSGKVRRLIEGNVNTINTFCLNNNIDLTAYYSKTGGKSEFRFWKEKPRIFPISKEIDIIKKLDYIHNNPVRRGLVKFPEDWKYSSFRYYHDAEQADLPVVSVRMSSSLRLDIHPDASLK